MKHLLAALPLLFMINFLNASNAEKAFKTFDAVARQEFQKLSCNLDREQSHINEIRRLLRKPITTTLLQNFEGVEAMHYAINHECCALTLALAYRGIPLFITDRHSKLGSPLALALTKFSTDQFELLLKCAINTQGYYIDQIDNYDWTLLRHLFMFPNFTPSIKMVELLVNEFKAEWDEKSRDAARVKLSSFTQQDRLRIEQLIAAPNTKFQSATPEMLAKINRKLEEAYNENQAKEKQEEEMRKRRAEIERLKVLLETEKAAINKCSKNKGIVLYK